MHGGTPPQQGVPLRLNYWEVHQAYVGDFHIL